jgi:hypothetical protein
MKKVVRLSESDLVRLVKRVIKESADSKSLLGKYVTPKMYNLTRNGKTTRISVGDVWTQKGLSASQFDYMKHDKSNIAFYCDSSYADQIGLENLLMFNGAQELSNNLRAEFCKGRKFNYDKYTSTECIEALKRGREGFQGCNVK